MNSLQAQEWAFLSTHALYNNFLHLRGSGKQGNRVSLTGVTQEGRRSTNKWRQRSGPRMSSICTIRCWVEGSPASGRLTAGTKRAAAPKTSSKLLGSCLTSLEPNHHLSHQAVACNILLQVTNNLTVLLGKSIPPLKQHYCE